jgi:hypothetical protein
MLGGGTFTAQNKILPGTYINFLNISLVKQSITDRGFAAMPLALDWGADNEVFTVTSEDFLKYGTRIFGYSFDRPEMLLVSEIFQKAHTGYFYKINYQDPTNTSNDLAVSNIKGDEGNNISIVQTINADDKTKVDVQTLYRGKSVDIQT